MKSPARPRMDSCPRAPRPRRLRLLRNLIRVERPQLQPAAIDVAHAIDGEEDVIPQRIRRMPRVGLEPRHEIVQPLARRDRERGAAERARAVRDVDVQLIRAVRHALQIELESAGDSRRSRATPSIVPRSFTTSASAGALLRLASATSRARSACDRAESPACKFVPAGPRRAASNRRRRDRVRMHQRAGEVRRVGPLAGRRAASMPFAYSRRSSPVCPSRDASAICRRSRRSAP